MAEVHSQNALEPGTRVWEYRIIRKIGAGSFGIVYQAEHETFEEIVAIKEFLPTELACRKEDSTVVPLSSETEKTYHYALDRFVREAKILRELEMDWREKEAPGHPNIARVRNFFRANKTAYMVMDFEEGKPLSRILKERGKIAEGELTTYLHPLLDGLERVHAKKVWHRDIKPSNILIRSDGIPVLIDFGAARRELPDLEHSSMVQLTLAYSAPEQSYGGEQGPWTDIYALGATLYRVVTGEAPVKDANKFIPAVQRAEGAYSKAFLAAIDAALKLDLRDRPQSIEEWRGFFPGKPKLDSPTFVIKKFSKLLNEWERKDEIIGENKLLESIFYPLLDELAKIHDEQPYCQSSIEPSNILIRLDTGPPVFYELGIMPRKNSGAYAAPEQNYPEKIGPWTDIYALGAILYHVATGAPPSKNPNKLASNVKITNGIYSKEFLTAIDYALKSDYQKRPQSIEDWKKFFTGEYPRPKVRIIENVTAWINKTLSTLKSPYIAIAAIAIVGILILPVINSINDRPKTPEPPPKPPIIEPKEGFLDVKPEPENSLIKLIGVDREYSPGMALGPGDYTAMVSAKGHKTEYIEIRIRSGKTETPRVVLEKLSVETPPSMTGHLRIEADPPHSLIRVMTIGPPFEQGMSIPPGKHKVVVSANGYFTQTKWVTITAGETETVTIVLEPKHFNNSLGMSFVWVEPGTFVMGSSSKYSKQSDDEKPHTVPIEKGFYMQNTEVTIGQFRAFIHATGYHPKAEASGGCYVHMSTGQWIKKENARWDQPLYEKLDNKSLSDDHPVSCVTWNDVMAFISWLSKEEKRDYDLPTEAEWEYACRAGTTTPFGFGDCLSSRQANYGRIGHDFAHCNSESHENTGAPIQVGQLQQNKWGLYDMHGNVAEWCRDWYMKDYSGSKPSTQGIERVIRGGHYFSDSQPVPIG